MLASSSLRTFGVYIAGVIIFDAFFFGLDPMIKGSSKIKSWTWTCNV